MNPNGETRIAWIAFVVLVAIIVLSVLCGCKTKTVTVKEYVTVHDTLTTYRTDTIRDVKVQTIRDTVKQVETHTFTLNNVGDTVKEIHHYHDLWHTLVVDSTDRYKATVDSLRAALRESQNKNTTIVKRYPIPWWLIVTFVVVIAGACVYALKKGKKFVDKI